MKFFMCVSILFIMNNIFAAEKLTVMNATDRAILIAYSHENSFDVETFVIDANKKRELPNTDKNPKEIELNIIGTMSNCLKMSISDHKYIVIAESREKNICVIQNGKVIGQVSI